MAGGTYLTQNKVRPGAYINYTSDAAAVGTVSDRGIATIPLVLSFGKPKEILSVTADTDILNTLGYALSDESLLLLRECRKRANTVLVYRVNDGTKASKTDGNLTVTALCSGVRGNNITVKIVEDTDNEGSFLVETYLDGELTDTQSASTAEGLSANSFVSFSGTGALSAHAGVVLSGGTDSAASSADYDDYFDAVSRQTFHTMALPVSDATVIASSAAFVRRMREDEGKRVQLVVSNYPNADYEGVISVKNGVVLRDGTVIDSIKATAYVAGMTAGAAVNESCTYDTYDDAADADIRYTNSEIITALKAGEFLFIERNGKAVVEQDINTYRSFTSTKGRVFSKNRLIRVMDSIGNDVRDIFESNYLGKVSNSKDGRNLFKSELVSYGNTLRSIGAIEDFDGASDITVEEGETSESVVVGLKVKPVDSAEKLYMTVTVS